MLKLPHIFALFQKVKLNIIQKIKHHINCPDDGLMYKPKRLTVANNSSINKIIL